MGASPSHPLLVGAAQVDWLEYPSQPWRSERSRELDNLGGLTRPPIKRGDSVTAKLEHLGAALLAQGHLMEKELQLRPAAASGGAQQPEAQQDLPSRPQVEVVTLRCGPPASRKRRVAVAAWRLRVHQARRRVMVVVLVAVRLWRGVAAPQRAKRIDGWGWAVANALGPQRTGRFVEDQVLCLSLRASLDANKALLEQFCHAFTTGSEVPAAALAAVAGCLNDGASPFLLESSPCSSPRAGGSMPNLRALSFEPTPPLRNAGRRLHALGSPVQQGSPSADKPAPPLPLKAPTATPEWLRTRPSPSRSPTSGSLVADSILERRARRMLMANADGDSPREVAEDADGDPGAAVDPTAGGFPQALQRLSLTVVAPSGLSSSCLSSLCASPLSGVGQRGRSVLSRGLQGVDVLAQAALLVSEAAEAGPQQQQRQARAQRVSDSVAAVSAAERASVVPLPSIATRRPPESGAASPRAPSEASSPKAQGDMGSAATASSPMGQRKGAGQRGLAAGAPASPQAGPAAKAAPAKPRYGFGSTISVPRVPKHASSEPGGRPPATPTQRSPSPIKPRESDPARRQQPQHQPPPPPPPQHQDAAPDSPAGPTTRLSRLSNQPLTDATSGPSLMPSPPPGKPPPRRPASFSPSQPLAALVSPQPPTLLPRTVAGAGMLQRQTTADRDSLIKLAASAASAADEPGDESPQPRRSWQRKLSKLRRGEPIQPLSILMASSDPPTPDTVVPSVLGSTLSPPSHTAATPPAANATNAAAPSPSPSNANPSSPSFFTKFNYGDDEGDDAGEGDEPDTAAAASQLDNSLPLATVRYGGFAADGDGDGEDRTPFELDDMQEMLFASTGTAWRAQLKEEIETMDMKRSLTRPDVLARAREEAELARLSTTGDAEDQMALERIRQAALKAREDAERQAAAAAAAAAAAPAGASAAQRNADKILAISKQITADAETLLAAEARLLMHLNRSNCLWASAQAFQAPDLWAEAEVENWLASPASQPYRQSAATAVRSGQVAVLYNAFEDFLELPNGARHNLWTSDPYLLLGACRPGLATHYSANGMTWGGRVLAQLMAGVEAAAGQSGLDAASALTNLRVVLAIDDEMQHAVVKDMWGAKFYGLRRENVLFVMQARRAAHRWDAGSGMFAEDPQSEAFPTGFGVSLLQLSWAGEAFILDEEGAPQPLEDTALELLQRNGVQWLMARRARDLGLISRTGTYSTAGLAYAAFLNERARAGMVADVALVDSVIESRAMDSVVVGCKSIYSAWRLRLSPDALQRLTLASTHSVVELSHLELQSAEGVAELTRVRAAMGGKLAVSCGRYLLHLPSLKKALTVPNLFRPKLQLAAGARVHVSVRASDLTALPDMRCLGMLVPHGASYQGALLGQEQLDALLALLQQQDNSPDFRKLTCNVGRFLPRAPPPPPPPAADAVLDQRQRQQRNVVVFVANNRVSQIAVDIACTAARPGRDCVRLVTCVSTEAGRDEAQELLIKFFRTCDKQGLAVSTDVVVRGEAGLLDCMEGYLQGCGAHLAVMGSVRLGQAAGNATIGSVVMSLLRRVAVPLLVVTPNSVKFAGDGLRPRLRVGMVVDSTCRPTHEFLCAGLADAGRGDALVLIQPKGTGPPNGPQALSQRRLLDSLQIATRAHNLTVLRTILVEGAVEAAVLDTVEAAGINVMAIQVAGHTVAPWVQKVLKECKGAVLITHAPVAHGVAL